MISTSAIDSRSIEARVIAFLSAPGVTGETVPQLHETHIARVFVGTTRAIKIKRPVKLPFLDFSTLEKRRAACLREIEINRPNAPEIYLGAVPITEQPDGTLAIGGPGTPVEWAVEMRPFAEADMLSARAAAAPLIEALCDATADVVHAMHTRAAVARKTDPVAKFKSIVVEVAASALACPGVLDRRVVAGWQAEALRVVAAQASALTARVDAGAIRRCHGDLHLGNIVVWRGKPTLFDALEFSEEMATIDTLYDLSFLLMDLEHQHQRAAANRIMNRYLWRSASPADIAGLALLPLYLSCRAAIRAMVAAERTLLANRTAADRRRDDIDAQSYLTEASSYLGTSSPRLVAVGGLSGSGKSTLAAALAPKFPAPVGALHLRSDLERKAMMGVEPTTRLGPEHYTTASSDAVYWRLLERAAAALEAGHSVIVDAVFAAPAERHRVAAVAEAAGVPFSGLWLVAGAAELRGRVSARRGDASDATPAVVDRQLGYEIGRIDWTPVEAGGSARDTLAAVISLLGLTPNTE